MRAEPALASLIGAADATVAVPEAAQAVATAALAALDDRGPILVVTPTGLDADRLGDDLACLLEAEDEAGPAGALAGPVTVLPAWETLPFERVSPETETMGRRLAILHALTAGPGDDLPPAPRVIVTPVRACSSGSAPWRPPDRSGCGPVNNSTSMPCCTSWSSRGTGASTRWNTVASSPCAAASSTCSPPPRTRRCASTCGVTRSTG